MEGGIKQEFVNFVNGKSYRFFTIDHPTIRTIFKEMGSEFRLFNGEFFHSIEESHVINTCIGEDRLQTLIEILSEYAETKEINSMIHIPKFNLPETVSTGKDLIRPCNIFKEIKRRNIKDYVLIVFDQFVYAEGILALLDPNYVFNSTPDIEYTLFPLAKQSIENHSREKLIQIAYHWFRVNKGFVHKPGFDIVKPSEKESPFTIDEALNDVIKNCTDRIKNPILVFDPVPDDIMDKLFYLWPRAFAEENQRQNEYD